MPREKWNSLSADEQQAIRDARDKAGIGTKRKVASMETEEHESKKAKTEDTTGVGDNMTRRSIKKRE
jgi:TRAP-type C4-dicarboxylate transport system substrate-binding protein